MVSPGEIHNFRERQSPDRRSFPLVDQYDRARIREAELYDPAFGPLAASGVIQGSHDLSRWVKQPGEGDLDAAREETTCRSRLCLPPKGHARSRPVR
jgi:hypothetical protein